MMWAEIKVKMIVFKCYLSDFMDCILARPSEENQVI